MRQCSMQGEGCFRIHRQVTGHLCMQGPACLAAPPVTFTARREWARVAVFAGGCAVQRAAANPAAGPGTFTNATPLHGSFVRPSLSAGWGLTGASEGLVWACRTQQPRQRSQKPKPAADLYQSTVKLSNTMRTSDSPSGSPHFVSPAECAPPSGKHAGMPCS